MGSSYLPPPEQNVVNVGDEISATALAGIQAASPSLSQANPAATEDYVASAISAIPLPPPPNLTGYAQLSGASFTGKVNFTPVSGVAGLNIGIGGTSTASTTQGDLWIVTGGANLNFRDGTGAWKVLASLQNGNVFNAPQTIDTTSTTTALRVTQKGTGEALRVEDELNPDSTPFVVGSDGRIGIHGAPAINTSHKLAIYNGNIVFSAGFGLAFGDGTTQTTRGLSGAQVSQWLTNNATSLAVQTSPNSGDVLTYDNGNLTWTAGGGGGGISDAPNDGTPYIRINGAWSPMSWYDIVGGGISDAPNDGGYYLRQNNSWVQIYSRQIYDSNSGQYIYVFSTSSM